LLFTESFIKPTFEEKVEVVAIELESFSMMEAEDLADFIFGEAGWKSVGGMSLGKPVYLLVNDC